MENNTENQDLSASEESPARRKRLLPLLLILLLVLMAGAVFYAFYSHLIIRFENGLYFHDAARIALVVSADEVGQLDYFTALAEADLRGSACYEEIALWQRTHPETTVLYDVPLPAGISYDSVSRTADLSGLSFAEGARAAAETVQYLPGLACMRLNFAGADVAAFEALQESLPCAFLQGQLTLSDAEPAELSRLRTQYPEMDFAGSIFLDGVSLPLQEEALDLSALPVSSYEAFSEILPLLPACKRVDFGTEDEGHTRLQAVSAFAGAHPEIQTEYRFTAFGKQLSFHDETLDFNHITMDDRGAEVRELLTHMPDVTFLDMDFCGVADEDMAAIRDDFPQVKVVWRIWFGTQYSVRTDVEKILASAPQVGGMLTPETTKSLIYCTDLKYLDIGHNEGLRDIYFVSYMPKLEVLIIMWGSITDISPLADCPHLEFLEIFTNNITDISPLQNLHELKHLNMCWNTGLKDLSPIYSLTQLERLWIGTTTGIPREQIEEFKRRVPGCEVNDWCGDPHTNWRWGTERYALLQEQLGYVNYEYEFYWRDPLYYPHDDEEED